MSSISSYATLVARIEAATQRMLFVKNAGLATGTNLNSWWTDPGLPAAGTIPSGAASIPDRTTTGSLGQLNKSASQNQRLWLPRAEIVGGGASFFGFFLVVDRVAHKGGLDGNVNTLQTVSTPALTRFTSGVGVWPAAEIYTAIGTTGSTISALYTNTAGTGSQATQPVSFGVTNYATARRVVPLSLASGDIGAKSVESCTLATASGTTGNFGITLYKTLGIIPNMTGLPLPPSGKPLPFFGPLCDIPDNACLQLLAFGSATNTQIAAVIDLFED